MRALIVDDEPLARARLRRLLETVGDVRVVGEAADGEQALTEIARLLPEVVFLDVQMPLASGLDVAASLPDPGPAVVFVSAHDHYALQAFEAAALDYLLKPVEADRLARTIERLRGRAAVGGQVPAARARPRQLLIQDRGTTLVVRVDEILWLEAADNYVIVHTGNAAPLMRRTLAGLLQDLGDGFLRTQRGAAVALDKVRGLRAAGRGDALVELAGGTLAPCSRQYRAALLERLAAGGSPHTFR